MITTCDFCGGIYDKFLDHLCARTGEIVELSDRYALETFIISKDAQALKLLSKEIVYEEE